MKRKAEAVPEGAILLMMSDPDSLTKINRLLKPHGVVIKRRSDYKNLGDHILEQAFNEVRAELATSRVTIQVLRGEACAEEKSDGNGGCGVCPTCAQEATARAEDAELQLSAARAELAKAREEKREGWKPSDEEKELIYYDGLRCGEKVACQDNPRWQSYLERIAKYRKEVTERDLVEGEGEMRQTESLGMTAPSDWNAYDEYVLNGGGAEYEQWHDAQMFLSRPDVCLERHPDELVCCQLTKGHAGLHSGYKFTW